MCSQSIALSAFILLAPMLCVAGGGNRLDYTQLPYDAATIKIIEQNTPSGFEEFYQEWSSPEMLSSRICAKYFQKNVKDSGSTMLLLFYGSFKTGVFKVISTRNDASYGKTVCETDSVFGEADVAITLYDIDCASINEVLLYSSSGAAAIQTLGIVKIVNGEIRVLRASPEYVTFEGRIIEIDKSGKECPRPIKVYVDGPVKYQPDTVKTYRIDSAKQSYRLESVQAIQQQKK